MSATPPVPPKAKQQAQQQSAKQQRAAERQRQLEEFKKREARSKRNRRILTWAGVAVGVAAVALLITAIVVAPKDTSPAAGGEGGSGTGAIEGVQTFSYQGGGHVEGEVDYAETPPAGGDHNAVWLNCGVYGQPVPNENAVHSLEHGAVWVTVDPDLPADELGKLTAELPTSYVVLSPYDGLPSPIVLSAWNAQLQVDDAADPRIAQFIEQYWQSSAAPEPGAPCSGAYDAPGKLS